MTQTVQIVLDEALLAAADQAAQRAKLNRSALVRRALTSYLKRLEVLEAERKDRRAYERIPDDRVDSKWEKEAVWPED